MFVKRFDHVQPTSRLNHTAIQKAIKCLWELLSLFYWHTVRLINLEHLSICMLWWCEHEIVPEKIKKEATG